MAKQAVNIKIRSQKLNCLGSRLEFNRKEKIDGNFIFFHNKGGMGEKLDRDIVSQVGILI